MDEQSLGTAQVEPVNFDDRLASLINRNEGMTPAAPVEQARTPSARDAQGRYMKVDENGYATPVEPKPAAEAEKAESAKVEPAKAAKEEPAAAEDDDDYLELPAEKEGEQPTRLKISEVLQGFNEAKTLRGELEGLRTQTRQMPAEIEKELSALVDHQTKYTNGITAITKMMQAPEPNLAYLDPNNPNYSPETYYAQVKQAENIKGLQAQLQAEADRVEAEQKANTLKLHNAKVEREMRSLLRDWPEFAKPEVQKQFVADAAKEYGLTAEEIASVTSARDYSILRDALAYRASKRAKETTTEQAVKVVKAKPKLVRGSARQPSNGKAVAYSDAMERLSKSHSIEDGLAAMRALNL